MVFESDAIGLVWSLTDRCYIFRNVAVSACEKGMHLKRPLERAMGSPSVVVKSDNKVERIVNVVAFRSRAIMLITLLWGHFTHFQVPDASKVECSRQTNVAKGTWLCEIALWSE